MKAGEAPDNLHTLSTTLTPGPAVGERRAGQVHRLAAVAAGASMVVGAAVLIGWGGDVRVLKQVAPGLASMKANTAIAFILAGASLWLMRDWPSTKARRRASRILAGWVAFVALLTLAEYVFGVDLQTDHLFADNVSGTTFPGRPSPHTALAFLGVGLWLIFLDARRGGPGRLRNWIAAATLSVVFQALVGYLYGVNYLYGLSSMTGMAIHTLATLIILCAGILASRPREGLAGLMTSDAAGGSMARRMVPVALFVPLLIGYIGLTAQQHGFITAPEGISILAGTFVVLTASVAVITGVRLNRSDASRRSLEQRLRELSERDPLTNLFNRRRFDDQLRHELALARRYGHQTALVLVDLDGLKTANDAHGHLAGDEFIVATAAALSTNLRATDYVARLGGDEFAVLLPHTGQEAAEQVAKKLIEGVRAVQPVGRHGLRCSISAGVAVTTSEPADVVSLVAAADRALYRAKAAGGDGYSADAI